MIAAILALAAAATSAPFRCGSVERPGIAERGGDGVWRGAAVERCRQVAQAERGSGAEIAFHPYRTLADLRDARDDDLAVLSDAERTIALPATRAPSGPPLAISRQVLLVRTGATLRNPSDLAGNRVCFIIATAAEAALNAWARPAHLAIVRVGFQEMVELRDAFDAGYCAAMAVDRQDIPGGSDHTLGLEPPLAELPVFAVRPDAAAR